MKIFPVLYLYVDPSITGLRDVYEEHVAKHNTEMAQSKYANSGFDVFSAVTTAVPPEAYKTQMIKLGIHAEMRDSDQEPTAYYLMPRSSFSKTPLIQSNSIGLIDSGYRGQIMAPVRNLSNIPYIVESDTRLFQLCHPQAKPFMVKLVNDLSELSQTERGDGGFGSTGLSGTKVI
jgi:dUTP pyrophosphatase